MSTTNILDLNNRLDRLEKSSSGGSAAETTYSNTTSGLTATNVQAAIDEIDGVTDNLAGSITDIEGDILAIEGDIDDLEGDVSSLDTRIDTLEVDTGWVQIGTGDTYYRKIGKIVYVRTNIPTQAANDWVTIDTLPEGFRSASVISFCVYVLGSAEVLAKILPTGEIQYARTGVSAQFSIYTSFVADN